MDGSSSAAFVAARRILIGVHATAGSQGVADTLAAIYEATPEAFDLVVLADPDPGEEAALAAALAGIAGVAQVKVPAPGGAAASFNQLLVREADVRVFLEAGAAPAPGWLGRLLRALDADAAHGLCGPATNRAWNAQALAEDCGPGRADLRRTAEALTLRHPEAWRATTPLIDLADVCLAVRREVVAAIGGADPAYGRGPCWEMDYAARAARAGFRSVWAPAAFVRRGPATAARRASDVDLLEPNKRLYQDRLCGRRTTPAGRAGAYHTHCAGEACADFAPLDAIRLYQPLPPAAPWAHESKAEPLPLISCVMPTRGRPRFVAQAIEYFRRQDYPNRELVIVYEGDGDLPAGIEEPSVRLLRTAQASIGGKREVGTAAAKGEIVVHWDDDDWYGPQRLSRQAAPILCGVADITGLNDILFMAMQRGEFWLAGPDLFRRMFVEDVSGGTLMFRKAAWRRSGPYPATSLREDADFMVKAMRDGARLCRLPGRDLNVYVRHDRNTWKFAEGRHLQPAEWSRVEAPAIWLPDREFYFGPALAALGLPAPRRAPLVSCIMPTAERRLFVPQAIRAFLSQDHAERELLVIDDGQDSVADLIPDDPAIRYVRLDRRLSVGAKRNLACELARGELIAHWDDDDWMAPAWLGAQVRTLLDAGADLCGLDTVFFYAPALRRAWRYLYDGRQPWVCGGTLCYRKELWARIRFSDTNVGEDNLFVWSPQPKRIAINPRNDLYVATVHRGNTSPKVVSNRRWREFPAAQVEQLMRRGALVAGAPASAAMDR
ncbi:MAG TPA: glycosyltransferase [Phenylobacterium sp.]|jgi:glycosyltransferase involved in cell wall biosynthesis/GT2 family glycosyltransferase|uniref:glycosyltransferase n=1 Tax=Phenylobacterium sp. TaxID=1871053 RepID=UPI002D30C184|nr:glycosyltransferase [Phenylobacterium sp.]HZZ70382.1 glycosyltransferase [Phenylobacterium sp.]